MSKDPWLIGQPHPEDPFTLTQRDQAIAKITGVHRHFSPVNGEVYEFTHDPELGWSSYIPGDESGSRFGAEGGTLHGALRAIHHADISQESAGSVDRERRGVWSKAHDEMARRTGQSVADPLRKSLAEDYADRAVSRWEHGNEGPIKQGPN